MEYGDQYFIQLDPDLAEPRPSVWGMNNSTTQIAVSVLVDRFLPPFLDRCATSTAYISTLKDDTQRGTVIDNDKADDD